MAAAGTYLADDFWLLAHDRPDGSSWLSSRTLNSGLAGALLAELVLAGLLDVQAGRLKLVSEEAPPDSLMHEVLADLRANPAERDVRTWLDYLAEQESGDASLRVAERLIRAGIVERRERRSLLRRAVRYAPLDARTGWPAVRLQSQAHRNAVAPVRDLMLVGLVGATELTRRVFAEHVSHPDTYVWWCVDRQLPGPLHLLVHEVSAAVGRAAATPL
ncbi:hypothetical protein GCM10020369_58450 [Cryptosporangium minutisporangium]|uniref:GPP34 family phosphoprotein n=1 Tax=Cryptosporangium minutisporangium TaxID=113569 RepID=A0ABP6T680_9ACTN